MKMQRKHTRHIVASEEAAKRKCGAGINTETNYKL